MKRYALAIILIPLLFFSQSCSRKLVRPASLEKVFFPAPPDTARIQFLTSISGSEDIAEERSAFAEYVLGEEEGRAIVKPYGISSFKGKLYICDTILGGLEVIDLDKKAFDYFTPGGQGSLKKPLNCTVSESGELYVADAERKQVVVFNSSGKYLTQIGNPKTMRPTDVAIFDRKIWISNSVSHKVHVYDELSKRELFSFPQAAEGDAGYLYAATNLTVTSDAVYVTDFGDFNIKVFDRDGNYQKSIGSYGRQIGNFVRPKGLAVDRNQNLFVVDAGFQNVQIFDAQNRLLMFFGGAYRGKGYMWLPAAVHIDYENTAYFQQYVEPGYNLKYLIFVTNQYGPDKINVYGHVEPKSAVAVE